MATFKDRFNQLFDESDLSQEDFGRLFSASKSQVFNWRSGRGEPDTDTIKMIARACNVSVEWLIGSMDRKESRSDNPENVLPEEALKKLEEYIDLLRLKYNKQPD